MVPLSSGKKMQSLNNFILNRFNFGIEYPFRM